MEDRRSGGDGGSQFAGSYPSPNMSSIPLQPAQQYPYEPYSASTTATATAAAATIAATPLTLSSATAPATATTAATSDSAANHHRYQNYDYHHYHHRHHSHRRTSSSAQLSQPQQIQQPRRQQQQQRQQHSQHMSLPPIQHFESHSGMQSHSQSHQSQSQHHQHSHSHPHPHPHQQHAAHSQPYAAQQQPPPYPPAQYHPYQNGGLSASMQASVPPNGQNGMMRYPIPPQQAPMDSRQMAAGRHKKEIKRRTKTGCLTCRKRRIKCDEAHPTCRNCQKSKRECLGYDPIFKPQPGPANIQPAPSGNGASASNEHNSVHPSDLAIAGAAADLASNPYPPSHAYPGTGGTFVPAGTASQPADGHYEYSASLDPALGGAHTSLAMAQNHYPQALQPHRKAITAVNLVSVDDLFALNGIPPRFAQRDDPAPLSPSVRDDVEAFYRYHYAIGLDRLFETTWYVAHGLDHLFSDPGLQDFVALCTEQFKAKTDDKALVSLEARLVWQLAIMPRAAAAATAATADAGSTGDASNALVQELLPRIDTIENLLTGQFLDMAHLPPPPSPSPTDASTTEATHVPSRSSNERAFWHHLGRFVSLRDDLPNPSTLKEVNDVLGQLRTLLNMLENRDVLYSLAIARHIGGRMPEFHPHRQLVASTADHNDDVNKLRVAHDFIETEDQRGTTQVIQRLCSMSIRSWILQKQ